MTPTRRVRPRHRLTSRLLTFLLVATLLTSLAGMAPAVSAEGGDEAAAATEVETAGEEPTPTAEANVYEEATEEPIVVETEPIVVETEPIVEETSLPVDEVVATETLMPVDETIPVENPPIVDEPPIPDETPPVTPTGEPAVPDDESVAEPSVEPTIEASPTPTPRVNDRSRRPGAADQQVSAAIFNLTVTLALSPSGSPVAGTSVTATASWTGALAGAPTGTVQYRVFSGSSCTGAVYAEAGTKTIVSTTFPSGSAPVSDAVKMNVAGALSWQVIYSGNVVYNTSTVCVNQTIAKRSPTMALAVAPSPGVAGDPFTGTATLSNATSTATGALTYTVYTTSSCATTLVMTGNPNTKTVVGGVAPASDPITINTAGNLGWKVAYAGDANNSAATSVCVAMTVSKRTPTVSITLTSATGAAGQTAQAQAMLTNATGVAGGLVTHATWTNATCTSTAISGSTNSKTAVGGVVPISNAFVTNYVSSYWKASYAGDEGNNPAASPCTLLTLAKASPTVTLSVSAVSPPMKAAGTALASATLSSTGATAATANGGGTASYTVYKESTCTTVLVVASSKTVLNRVVPNSSNTVINQAGFVYWRIVYAGDMNNNGATSACVELAVAKADPTSTLTITPGVSPMKAGGTASARGTFSTTATATITGAITYGVYTDSACTTLFSVAGNPSKKTVTNRTTVASSSFTFLTATTHYWRMDFLGDANNNPATGPCTALVVAKSTPTLTLTAVPVASPMKAGGSANGKVTMTLSNTTAGGTATYTVYSDSACTTTFSVAGSPSTVTVTNKLVPNSATITFPTVGTYYWQATYTGDANNSAATSACSALVVGTSTPTLSLTASPAGSVVVNGSAMGIATLGGATAGAGGTATYTVYTDNACTVQLAVAGSPSTVTVTNAKVAGSSSVVFSVAEIRYWRASYSGDANNAGATSGCVSLTVTKKAPTLGLTVTHLISPTQAGGTAYGSATLSGATGDASGDVVYTVFTNNICTTPVSPPKTSTETVSNGAIPSSDSFTFDGVGTFYYWRGSYGGDANNLAATSGCVALNVVNGATASIELLVNPDPMVVDGSVNGEAVLTGVTGSAGGTVVYTVYVDATCTTPVSPAKTSSKTVTNGVVAISDAFAFSHVGTIYWAAAYSGDANNLSAASPCIRLVVNKASPSIGVSVSPNPVRAGAGAVGTASLAGASVGAAGTATFTIYTNNVCSTALGPSHASVRTVSGAVVPGSAPLTVQQSGTVYWRVVYTGDANNNGATSPCLAVTVSKATPTVALTSAPSSIGVWDSVGASATLSGSTIGAGGRLVYTLYADDGCSTPASPTKASTRTVTNGTVPGSAVFTFTDAGVVYWQAAYGGDGNNLDAESGCVPLTVVGGALSVSVSTVTMTPVTYSATDQANTGVMVLRVVDRRGTSEGWSVTLTVSDFAYTGASPIGRDIPTGAFSIDTAYAPVYVQGQLIDGENGPAVPAGGTTGPLGSSIVVLVAADGFGAGEYTQSYDVVLIIPAGSQAGTYTAVIAATTSAAP